MSNQIKVRCMLYESIAFVDVDRVYDAMDAGNKQHMANKLYKHGWPATRCLPHLPTAVVNELVEAKRADTYKFLTEDDVKPGDFVKLVNPSHFRHGGVYVASKVDRQGTLRLINPENGSCWSHTSLFGTDGTFIRAEEDES